jgi:hypothetical protein
VSLPRKFNGHFGKTNKLYDNGFPAQRMSTIQDGIGIHHPLPRPRKTQEAVKIGTKWVSQHYHHLVR